jgi:hypothetical protein
MKLDFIGALCFVLCDDYHEQKGANDFEFESDSARKLLRCQWAIAALFYVRE